MQWNLRLTAAQRGIWKASDLRGLLAEHGLVISAGKMSALWSGQPVTIRLADLDVICVVLDCQVSDLLIAEPDTVSRPQTDDDTTRAAASGPGASGTGPRPTSKVVPRRRDGRSLPPA